MAKAKAICPRCGNPNAKANAQGPDFVFCKKCGGLVPVRAEEDYGEMFHSDPVSNAIAKEEGRHQKGQITHRPGPQGPLSGGK